MNQTFILGLPPTQDSSHHQDYEPFLVGNPELNLHLPLLLGGGYIQYTSIKLSEALDDFSTSTKLTEAYDVDAMDVDDSMCTLEKQISGRFSPLAPHEV